MREGNSIVRMNDRRPFWRRREHTHEWTRLSYWNPFEVVLLEMRWEGGGGDEWRVKQGARMRFEGFTREWSDAFHAMGDYWIRVCREGRKGEDKRCGKKKAKRCQEEDCERKFARKEDSFLEDLKGRRGEERREPHLGIEREKKKYEWVCSAWKTMKASPLSLSEWKEYADESADWISSSSFPSSLPLSNLRVRYLNQEGRLSSLQLGWLWQTREREEREVEGEIGDESKLMSGQEEGDSLSLARTHSYFHVKWA